MKVIFCVKSVDEAEQEEGQEVLGAPGERLQMHYILILSLSKKRNNGVLGFWGEFVSFTC